LTFSAPALPCAYHILHLSRTVRVEAIDTEATAN
jgi:hypothetical protein